MPLYDFRCEKGHTFERMVKLADFEEIQLCDCAAPSIRLISTPRFFVDQVDYQCPITGTSIRNKQVHEENLARQGCRVLERGEKEQNDKTREAADQAFEKSIDDSVEQAIEAMPGEKREKLANELIEGRADISVERI